MSFQNGTVAILPLLLILLLGYFAVFAQSTVLTPQLVTQMTESLFPADYSSFIRPKFGKGPVLVNISLSVHSINQLEAKSPIGSIRLKLKLKQTWHDERLNNSLFENSYDKSSWISPHQNSYTLFLDKEHSNKLWTPKTYFVDAISQHPSSVITFGNAIENVEEVQVQLSTKTVFTSKSLDLTVNCRMFFGNYPYDNQRCNIELKNSDYFIDDVVYLWSKLSGDAAARDVRLFQAGDFYLSYDSAKQKYLELPKERYSRPALPISMRRKPIRLHLFLHIPVLILVALSWFPENLFGKKGFSNRITFLGILLLAFCFLATGHWCFQAPTTDRLTLADQFLLVSLLLLVLAFVDACVKGFTSSQFTSSISTSQISYSVVEGGKENDKRENLTTIAKCWFVFRTYFLLPFVAFIAYCAYSIWLCLLLSISNVGFWDFF